MNNQQYLDNCETMNFQNGDILATARVPKLLADFVKDIKQRRFISQEHIFLAALTIYAYSQQNNFVVPDLFFKDAKDLDLKLFSMCFIPSGCGVTTTLNIFENLTPSFYDEYDQPYLCEARELLQCIKAKKTSIEKKKECAKRLKKIMVENMHYLYYVRNLQRMNNFHSLWSYSSRDAKWFNRTIDNTIFFYDGDLYKYHKNYYYLLKVYDNEYTDFIPTSTILNITEKNDDNRLLKEIRSFESNFGIILMCDYKEDNNQPLGNLFIDKDSTSYKKFNEVLFQNLKPQIINPDIFIDDLGNILDSRGVHYSLKSKSYHILSKKGKQRLKFCDTAKQFADKYFNSQYLYYPYKRWYVFMGKSAGPAGIYQNIVHNTCRIAALFHLAAGLDENTEISKPCLEAAFRVANFYIKNSMRVISNYKGE